ncbi:hypothetical protein DSC45_23475 [Streptomyces sp. YIM 130001]|nr:hypothetical protein DSC45_23475 [Streptomyces sp. YIM 130001]
MPGLRNRRPDTGNPKPPRVSGTNPASHNRNRNRAIVCVGDPHRSSVNSAHCRARANPCHTYAADSPPLNRPDLDQRRSLPHCAVHSVIAESAANHGLAPDRSAGDPERAKKFRDP